MTVLNTANAIRLGSTNVNRVYAGSTKVWPGYEPSDAFVGGYAGWAYDPSDNSKLWKEVDGTSPVTGVGDVLARLDDLSGNGSHRTQATLASRPVMVAGGRYMTDGVDDQMLTVADTSSGGTWTWIVRYKLDLTSPVAALLGDGGSAYVLVYQSGRTFVTMPAIRGQFISLDIDGVSIVDDRGTFYTALASGIVTIVFKGLYYDASWNDQFMLAGLSGARPKGEFGREIMVNRDLTGTDLSKAINWVES